MMTGSTNLEGWLNPSDHGTKGITQTQIINLFTTPPCLLRTPEDSWRLSEDNTTHVCVTQMTGQQSYFPRIVVENFSAEARKLNITKTVFRGVGLLKRRVALEKKCQPVQSIKEHIASDERDSGYNLIKSSHQLLLR